MSAESILITGANGYLGLRLAETLLDQREESLILFLHADNKEVFELKADAVLARLKPRFNDTQLGRLKMLAGDLGTDEPFENVDKNVVREIIHCAAVTRFNVDAELADKVNVLGSRRLLRFAESCAGLNSVQFLSTVYASGLRTGKVMEEALARPDEFSNHYERSKWESENLLNYEFKDLPVNIIRIATMIADNERGEVTQQNAFHNTLKLFYYGLLSLFPGEKETPVYFVTGDFVLNAIMSIIRSGQNSGVYHVCHSSAESARLEELVDVVFSTFESYRDFKLRRVLRPLWSDVESFDLLNQGLGSLSSGVMAQAVSSVSPFSRQLFAPKEFDNSKLRSIMPDYRAPDPLKLIANTASFLADTKWGRQLQEC